MRIVTILLALATIGLGAAVVVPRMDRGEGRPVHLHAAGPGALEWIVRAEGRVEARRESDLAFEVPGRLVEVPVERGQTVKAGDALARLDDATLRLQERQVALDLDMARVALAEIEAGSRAEEVEEARARVEGARAELEQAGRDLEKSRQLFGQQALDRQSLEHDEMRVDLARSQLRALEKRVRLLEAGARPEERQRAVLAVSRAELGLLQIRDRIAKTVLHAPFDGRVTFRYLDPGEMAGPERPVLTLSDTAHLEVVLEIDEFDVGALRPGLEAIITSRALPGETLRGTVREIAEVIGKRRARGDDPTVIYDSRVVEARIPVGEDRRLRPGMSVDGEIAVVRRQADLVIPLLALGKDAGGHPAVRLASGAWQPVTTGTRDRRDVEIREGLKAGDVVRVPPEAE